MQGWQAGAAVFVGGGLGANARYWLGSLLVSKLGNEFPWATFIINVTGSLLIGLCSAIFLAQIMPSQWRVLLVVGVLGGYTTFSSFSQETLDLIQKGQWSTAVAYQLGSCLLGLSACALGFAIGRSFGGQG